MAVNTRFICANGRITQRPSGTVDAVVDAVGIQQRVEVLDASRSLGHGPGVSAAANTLASPRSRSPEPTRPAHRANG